MLLLLAASAVAAGCGVVWFSIDRSIDRACVRSHILEAERLDGRRRKPLQASKQASNPNQKQKISIVISSMAPVSSFCVIISLCICHISYAFWSKHYESYEPYGHTFTH